MSQRKDPRSCKSQLRGWSTMIFIIILQLTHISGGESLANSQYRMLAVIGHTQNITLPCSVSPATDVVDEMVEWSRSDLNPRFVHVRRSGEDRLVDQNPSYKERASMSVDRLKMGDASLKLTKVRLSDEGTYRCFVPGLKTDFSIELVVEADIQITKVSPGVLECKSEGWYPEPEVLWLERERKLLSAGSKETFRGPDDLYTLSSRLTLEKGHSNNFTCRIQQNNLHREAIIYVPDDFFVEPSSSARSVIGLIAGIMFISVVLFLVWKWRKNKMENKKSSEDGESQSSREDSRCSSSKNPEEESLIKKKSSLTEIETQPEPVDSNIKTPNQSMMDNSRQQQQLDTHMKENTKKTQTISDETASQSPSEEKEKQEMKGENNPEVEKKDRDGERTETTNNETTDPLNRNVSQPNPAEGEQDNREEDSGPNPNTQASHLEENRTSQEHSGTTEPPMIEENQSENTSVAGDQQEHSTASTNATSGAGDQNNDTSGVTTETTNKETADPLDRNVSQPSSTEGGQNNREEDSGPNPDTQPSHLEENRTSQEHSGRTEQPTTEENQSKNTSAIGEGSVGGDHKEHLPESTDAKSGAGDQNNDTNGVITQTTNNEIADPLDRNVSQPKSAEGGETEEGQDNREEDRGANRDTQPSHLEENGTIQAPSGRTEQPTTEESQSKNTSATDDRSVVGEHSTESTDAKSGLKDQNNDGNGERTKTTNNKIAGSTD